MFACFVACLSHAVVVAAFLTNNLRDVFVVIIDLTRSKINLAKAVSNVAGAHLANESDIFCLFNGQNFFYFPFLLSYSLTCNTLLETQSHRQKYHAD